MTLIIRHAGVLVTMDAGLREIRDGALVADGSVLCWVGTTADLPPEYRRRLDDGTAQALDLPGHVLMPVLDRVPMGMLVPGMAADFVAFEMTRGVSDGRVVVRRGRLLPGRHADALALTGLRRVWSRLTGNLFDNGGLEAIFTHARNVLTGTIVMAAGVYAIDHLGWKDLPGTWAATFPGYLVAALGAMLLGLNLLDGLRKLSQLEHRLVFRVVAIVAYAALSIRLTQVFIYFRTVY